MDARDIIKKKPHLIWHTVNYDTLSDEAVVEAVLNYGEISDFIELLDAMGKERVAEIFNKESNKERSNYRPEIKNYFDIFFKKNA